MAYLQYNKNARAIEGKYVGVLDVFEWVFMRLNQHTHKFVYFISIFRFFYVHLCVPS